MSNRLAQEKSPYLLQHAENPVSWYPWGEEAFALAKSENKPIFLSIGYSTCHWCHVMVHESFENETIAQILNEHFVSVKVDREERPDVDHVYMSYVQAVTGHGGWPLSAWLTPELKPFFGGTYFPPDDAHGRPGFVRLLQSIAQAWRNDPAKLMAEGSRAIETLELHQGKREEDARPSDNLDFPEAAGEAFEKCFQQLYESFDSRNGGFGGAPKFPRASNLNFLFRVAAIQGVDTEVGAEAIKLATATLRKMAEGGIHDHVGGGFHRYSVDESWFVPHFEKMLYDQAQIALNYLDAFRATGQEVYLWTAKSILRYVQRDLTDARGAFYSAEDADSRFSHDAPEHAEGAFYVWTEEEINRVLRVEHPFPGVADLSDLVRRHFGVLAAGNVPAELDRQREFTGKNILCQRSSIFDTARQSELDVTIASDRLVEALVRLKVARDRRPRPHRDDKVITAWNGLMISAFAHAAQVARVRMAGSTLTQAAQAGETAEIASYLPSALSAAQFIRSELYDSATGTLYRSFRAGRAPIEGFAEDYAFLIQAVIDVYEASFDLGWLRWADELQDQMDRRFWDDKDGGYFQAREGDASIVLRLKDDYDGAEPAAGSVAAMNLWRLAPISQAPERRRERARRTLESLRPTWSRIPQALPQALCALEYGLTEPRQIVIAGDASSPEFAALWQESQRGFGPRRTILTLDRGDELNRVWLIERAPWLSTVPRTGRALAYVCEHYTCQAPVAEPAELRRLLG